MEPVSKLIDLMLSDDKNQRTTRVILNNGSLMMYMFAGILFTRNEYFLSIGCVVVGYLMIQIREVLKDYMSQYHGKPRKKS